jgi:hypothetical protein
MESKSVLVKADPENPGTVILNRWPTEREKTKALKALVEKARES